jgi:large subunit ribosomal protein L15
MKLHDLKPAAGSRRPRTRVGRGIAAGQGKTAGRGTKGQRARAGASIPPWFEGGQTPIHIRVPKLHGFKNRFRVEFAVVNVGQISAYAEAGRFGVEAEQAKPAAKGKAAGSAVVTINAEVLAQAGLIRSGDKPLKVLGQGDVSQKLFVAAQAFSASARRKIEQAGGFVQVLGQTAEEAEAGTAVSAQAPAAEEQAPAAAAAEATPVAAEVAPVAAEVAPVAAKSSAHAAKTAKVESQSPSTGESKQPAATEAPAAKPRRRAAKSDEQG